MVANPASGPPGEVPRVLEDMKGLVVRAQEHFDQMSTEMAAVRAALVESQAGAARLESELALLRPSAANAASLAAENANLRLKLASLGSQAETMQRLQVEVDRLRGESDRQRERADAAAKSAAGKFLFLCSPVEAVFELFFFPDFQTRLVESTNSLREKAAACDAVEEQLRRRDVELAAARDEVTRISAAARDVGVSASSALFAWLRLHRPGLDFDDARAGYFR